MQVSPHDIGSKMQVLARQRGHLTSLAGIALALVLACALCLVAPGTAMRPSTETTTSDSQRSTTAA